MHFIIYETTNTINGKKYRGAHICESLDDGYLGSGKLLKKAIVKYGVQCFQRTILHEATSIEEMFQAEAKFVNDDWVTNPSTYNLKVGGEGGWDYINKTKRNVTGFKRDQEYSDKMRAVKLGKKHKLSEEGRRRLSEDNPMKRPEVAKKLAESLSGNRKSDEHKANLSASIREWHRKRKEARR